MKAMLGCLFILIFGGIFLAFGIFRFIFQTLFGTNSLNRSKWNAPHQNTQQGRPNRTYGGETHSEYTSGNAHHEASNGNSRQQRKGKIFDKNEGEYVDFEEV